jgi:hypothetical protein
MKPDDQHSTKVRLRPAVSKAPRLSKPIGIVTSPKLYRSVYLGYTDRCNIGNMTEVIDWTPKARAILRAASDLFYAEGINTVGIDRVIEHAGVAVAQSWRGVPTTSAAVGVFASDEAVA